MKKLLCVALALTLAVSLLAGCDGTTTPPAATGNSTPAAGGDAGAGTGAPQDKMFNVALTAPFTGFDPLRTNDSASTYVNAQIYETL